MFEKRIKFLLSIAALAMLVVVGRLFQLQVVSAGYYRERAERALLLRPQRLPFVRGAIADRWGEVLVRDDACWELQLDFGAIAAMLDDVRQPFLRRLRQWFPNREGESRDDDERLGAFHDELELMWTEVASILDDGTDVLDLKQDAYEIYDRIRRIRAGTARRRGFDSPVAEERSALPIATGLNAHQRIEARERLRQYPWIRINESSQRMPLPESEPMAHILGRLARVDAQTVANDSNGDDPFARYLGTELIGASGIEYVAERSLRGRRGQLQLDRHGNVVPDETVEPVDGADAFLTIDARLQRRLFDALGEAVRSEPFSTGGAIVVLDVVTREILALVSYPSYDPASIRFKYNELANDTTGIPLMFRAVSSRYAPGSTVKPLVCLAGLTSNVISVDTEENCTGYLFEDVTNAWRCWPIHGTRQRMRHGDVNVVGALKGSCNIFMYRLGEKLGVDRLCDAFHGVGIGLPAGTGLREEASGLNPRREWLQDVRGVSVTPGLARLFAMGQGQLLLTPLQVANLMATYANGRFKPVTLLLDGEEKPEWILPASQQHMRAIRRGMFGVVNAIDGTAYKPAYFAHPRWAICGKTGSATVYPRPTSYDIPFEDGAGQVSTIRLNAGSVADAIERFKHRYRDATFDPGDIRVASKWPEYMPADGGNHSHAWFGGFVQRIDDRGEPAWGEVPKIAFSVLIEYGGSGGRTSGPVARSVVEMLLDLYGEELSPGTSPVVR